MLQITNMQKTLTHTIRDKSPNTKKDVELFRGFIEQGYIVMDVFSYKNEYYYIMAKHVHDKDPIGEDFAN